LVVTEFDRPAPTPSARPASRDPIGDLLRMINRDRESRGLAPVRSSPVLAGVAQRHAQGMQRADRIYHNSWLFTPAAKRALGYPLLLGENVGVEHSVEEVHRGFMDSAEHRSILLSPSFDRVGIGVVVSYRSYWVVEDYATWSAAVARRSTPPRSKDAASSRAGATAPRSAGTALQAPGSTSAAGPGLAHDGAPAAALAVIGSLTALVVLVAFGAKRLARR
jgi:hypothetical protein